MTCNSPPEKHVNRRETADNLNYRVTSSKGVNDFIHSV